jgi:PAS domain S-box-containing protein
MVSPRNSFELGGGRPRLRPPTQPDSVAADERLDVLTAALDAAANGVVICDCAGRITWANPALTDLTGYTAADVIGRSTRIFKSGKHDAIFYRHLWDTILSGNVWRGEITNRRKDGTLCPEEMTITPVRGAGGEIQAFIAIKQEITARKLSETALARSEARFRNLANCLPEIVLETDLNGTITFANSNARRLLGKHGRELAARVRLTDLMVPADRERALIDFRRLLAGQAGSACEYDALGENGSAFRILVSPSVIVEGGQPVGMRAIAVDITARKQAEDALRLTQFAVDNAADGILWLDPTGKVLYANDSICRSLGYSRAELLSMTVFQFDPDLTPEYWQTNWEAGKSGAMTFEARNRRKDGTVFPVRITASQAAFCGKEYGFAVIRDITASKRADAELARARHLFETLMETVPDCIYFKDRDGRFLRISRAQARLFGLSDPSQAVGRTDFDFFNREHAQQAFGDELEILETGKPLIAVEEKETWPDGRETWASTTKVRFSDPDGQVIGTLGISRDITPAKGVEKALRASEEFAKRIIESSSDGVGVLDKDGLLLYVSAGGRKLLGLDEETSISQRSWLGFWEGPDREKARAALQNASAGRTGAYQGSLRSPAGKPELWDVVISPITRANGEVERLVCVFRDITERRLLESQLAQAQKLESIGQLAAGIAHEINTPIQYIGDNGRFLEEAFGDLLRAIPSPDGAADPGEDPGNAAAQRVDLNYLRDEIPKAIQQLLEGVEHVARIVRAMKEFSHPGAVEKTLVNINAAIESTVLVSRNEWKYVADVTVDLDPELPRVSCLPGEFNQVMLNLIVNSAQAIGEVGKETGRKGAIRIATRRDGSWANIRISDTGPGIPAEIQSKVFDPFFTTKPVGKGTGQGLAIAHSVIVRKHRGTISFESNPATGTTFLIRLPLGTETSEDEARTLRR